MRKALKVIGFAALGLLLVAGLAAAWFMRPLGAQELKSRPSPATDYLQSRKRIEAIESASVAHRRRRIRFTESSRQ